MSKRDGCKRVLCVWPHCDCIEPTSPTPEEKLKPCPFGCEHTTHDGEAAVVLICQRDVKDDYAIAFGVRCNHCGIEIWEEYKDEAITAWNRRSPSRKAVALEGLVAAIRSGEGNELYEALEYAEAALAEEEK